jgi:hypothetical protein
MIKNTRKQSILTLSITMALLATVTTVSAASLNLTVSTSKPSYFKGEDIIVYGYLTYNGAPVQDNPVGLQIFNPSGDPVVSRTLQTNASGAYSHTFKLPSDAESGVYQVYVSSVYKNQQASSNTTFQYEYQPKISITPATKVVGINEEFNVSITLDHAENLYGFEFWLSFDKTKLNATAIHYTNYLNEPTMTWYKNINNTEGYLALAVSSLYPATGKTGGGDLAIVSFKSLAVGTSPLHLYKTYLADDKAKNITHITIDGTVYVTIGEIHDIAVTNVTPLKTIVGQGYTMNINVTVTNKGEFTETFNVTLYANTTAIETKQVTLTSLNSTTLTFTWNTSEFVKGNYTLWAYAEPVQGETDTADNNFTNGWVIVTMPGDVVEPYFEVDIFDVTAICICYDQTIGQPLYQPDYDIDYNGIIDIYDLVTACINYGQTDP